MFFMIAACMPRIVPEIQTQTKAGETITETPIQRTADKNDVPPGDGKLLVIIPTMTESGELAKTYITQEPFNPLHPFRQRLKVRQNAAAKKASPATGGAVLPKIPWYHWPLVYIEWISLLACIIGLLYLRGLLAPVIRLFKR
jgi:hypothetical protein